MGTDSAPLWPPSGPPSGPLRGPRPRPPPAPGPGHPRPPRPPRPPCAALGPRPSAADVSGGIRRHPAASVRIRQNPSEFRQSFVRVSSELDESSPKIA